MLFALASSSVTPTQASFGIGVRDRWNHASVEPGFLAGRGLGGDMRLVHGLVRQHRLPGDVADRENMRDVGPQLVVDRDEAALVDDDARALSALIFLPFGDRPTATSTRS